jgi:hypothetical protein
MAQKTVTRADLAEAVYEAVGLSRTESAELVERVLELISDALVKGENLWSELENKSLSSPVSPYWTNLQTRSGRFQRQRTS